MISEYFKLQEKPAQTFFLMMNSSVSSMRLRRVGRVEKLRTIKVGGRSHHQINHVYYSPTNLKQLSDSLP